MPVAVVDLLKIVHVNDIDHRGLIFWPPLKIVLHLPADRALVIQTGQLVAVRLVNQRLGRPLLLVDVRHHAHRFVSISHIVELGRSADLAPAVTALRVRQAELRFPVHLPGPDPLHQLIDHGHIFRMYVGHLHHPLAGLLRDGYIAELFHPVGRVGELIFSDIPLENHVVGLVHNDLMAFQRQPQLILSLLRPGNIDQNAEQGLLSVLTHCQLTLIQHPHNPLVPGHNPVFQLHRTAGLQLFLRLAQNLLAVGRINEIEETVLELASQLLVPISQHLHKSLVHLHQGEPAVIETLLDPSHQIVKQTGSGRLHHLKRGRALRLRLPDHQRAALMRLSAVDPQQRNLTPAVFLRQRVKHAEAVAAACEPVFEKCFHIPAGKLFHQPTVIRVHQRIRKIRHRLRKTAAGAQQLKGTVRHIDHMVDSIGHIHLHDRRIRIF